MQPFFLSFCFLSIFAFRVEHAFARYLCPAGHSQEEESEQRRTKTNETRSCILKAARRQRKREGEGLYDQAEVEMRARLMYRLITVQLHHPSLRNKCVCFLLISHQPRRRHGTRAVIRWSTYLYLMIHNYFIFISCWCVVGKFSR